MQGMMMERPLLIADILTYAAEVFGDGEVISAQPDGTTNSITYRAIAGRVAQLANALVRMGVQPGDKVATLAWNDQRHFELYHAISGIGAICHTLNPRLPPAELAGIVSHAGSAFLFADAMFAELATTLARSLTKPGTLVALNSDAGAPAGFADYDALIKDEPASFRWPEFPETTAAGLCYTSGTTGSPKGALYTHRSTLLHALFLGNSVPGTLQEGRRILPVVPLFHVNAWGLPYAAPLSGASLVMPGPQLDGPSLFRLMDRERVFSAWGVPTVWHGLLAEIDRVGRLPEGFADVVIGGSAAPPAMIARFEARGVNVCHAWGMTEMSPVGTQGNLSPHFDGDEAARLGRKATQGRRLFGVDLRIVGDDGALLPHDGVSAGRLMTRGNTVISGYYGAPEATDAAMDADGWFATGDIATIDGDGFLAISDRVKDMVKSGGEWISSIDLENAALAHDGVSQCAVIAVPHEKWGERPLLVVVPAGEVPDKAAVLESLASKFARWQLPDDVVFVDALPLTATGKVSKRTLRERFANDHPRGAAE